MSNTAEFTQDQDGQNGPINQTSLNADKGGRLGDATTPEEVAALESSTTTQREDVPADFALKPVADNGDEKKGASKAKVSKRTPLAFQLQEMELRDIYDEHPLVDKVREEVGLQLRELPTTVLSKTGLVEIATHVPLHVVQELDEYYCIGGLRFFRLVRYGLQGETVVPVFLYAGLNAKKLRSHILFDLFMMPALGSVDMHDRQSLKAIWTKFEKVDPFARAFDCKIDEAFSKLLNCDLRTGKARSESRRSKPE